MSSMEGYEEKKRIDRTKTGILLLLVGVILGAIPIIELVGGILALIGVIFIIFGRDAFSEDHSKKVILSVGLWIFGVIIAIIVGVSFVFSFVSIAQSPSNPSVLARDVQSAVDSLLGGILVASAFTGLAYVFITDALQNRIGRLLLWLGFIVSLTIGLILGQSLRTQFSAALLAALESGNANPIEALGSQIQSLGLWDIVPSALYAIAYYLVWSRIDRGELPETVTPHTAPTAPTTAA